MNAYTRAIALSLTLVCVLVLLCGCHGARTRDSFAIPADFDPDASYEITFWAKHDTNIATQTTPNVCITYPDHIATYKTGTNVVVPLDTLMKDKAYGLGGSALRFDAPTREELVPSFLAECVIDDVTYALPYMRSTEA